MQFSKGMIKNKEIVFEKFSSLHRNPRCSDVTLIIGKERIEAHRFVLGAHSRVFEVMLFGVSFREGHQNDVTIGAPIKAFEILLEYIYTGTLDLCLFNLEDVTDLLELSHRYEIFELEEHIKDYLFYAVDAYNACQVLEIAILLEIDKLKEACWTLIEMIIEGIYEVELDLSFENLVELVYFREKRVSEVNLFKHVMKLINENLDWAEKQKKHLLKGIQYERMNAVELFTTVKPSKILPNETFYKLIEKINLEQSQKAMQGIKFKKIVKVTAHKGSKHLFSKDDRYAGFNMFQTTTSKERILADLGDIYSFNHLKFKLATLDREMYQYSIEVSNDNSKWTKIIDFSKYWCRKKQSLYFPEVRARYIKINGKNVNFTEEFLLNSFEILFSDKPKQQVAGLIIPQENIIFPNNYVTYKCSGQLPIFEDIVPYTFTHWLNAPISNDHAFISININQPYILDSCDVYLTGNLLLTEYPFTVRVVSDEDNHEEFQCFWKSVENGLQSIKFSPRPVIRFEIVGTSTKSEFKLSLMSFKAPSQQQK